MAEARDGEGKSTSFEFDIGTNLGTPKTAKVGINSKAAKVNIAWIGLEELELMYGSFRNFGYPFLWLYRVMQNAHRDVEHCKLDGANHIQ